MTLARYIHGGRTRAGFVAGLPIYKPRVSEKMDSEVEMGAVIGKRRRYVWVDDARSVVGASVVAHDEIEHLGSIENRVGEEPVPTP